jgi:hypothetical protein
VRFREEVNHGCREFVVSRFVVDRVFEVQDELADEILEDGNLGDNEAAALVNQRPFGNLVPIQIADVQVRLQ